MGELKTFWMDHSQLYIFTWNFIEVQFCSEFISKLELNSHPHGTSSKNCIYSLDSEFYSEFTWWVEVECPDVLNLKDWLIELTEVEEMKEETQIEDEMKLWTKWSLFQLKFFLGEIQVQFILFLKIIS